METDTQTIEQLQQQIEALKKRNAELEASERQYKDLFENSLVGVSISKDGKLISANKAMMNSLHYDSFDELAKQNVFDYVAPESKELLEQNLADSLIEKGKKAKFEIKVKRKDGDIRDIEVSTGEILIRGETYRQSAFRDITDAKRWQEENEKLQSALFESKKMESIGRLAGGIAHDFGNILTIILGHADELNTKFEDTGTEEGKAVSSIMRNTLRSKELVSQLLKFARRDKHEPEPVSINKLIQETMQSSEKLFDESITITFELADDLFLINGDKNKLDQVFLNMAVNARDAMPQGGELILKTENVTVSKDKVLKSAVLSPGSYVNCEIRDTGTGIPEEVAEHIFEPFYTTKESGMGTGLGLATVYGILKDHKAVIDLQSQVGQGTSFSLYFPAHS